jgi:hypothetical protein
MAISSSWETIKKEREVVWNHGANTSMIEYNSPPDVRAPDLLRLGSHSEIAIPFVHNIEIISETGCCLILQIPLSG